MSLHEAPKCTISFGLHGPIALHQIPDTDGMLMPGVNGVCEPLNAILNMNISINVGTTTQQTTL